MLEPAHPERDSLYALDQVVERFGRSVADASGVPGDDLGPPAAQRPCERADLDGHLGFGHVIDQLAEERVRGVGIDDVVERSDGPFCVPGHAGLATGVTGFEQSHQLRLSALIEVLMRFGQQASGAVERIVLAAPMTHRLVLDSAAALVELGGGVADEVERVGDLDGVGQAVVVDLAVGPGHVQHTQSIPARRTSGWASIHSDTSLAVRPSTTSISVARRPAVTSTTGVHQFWVRNRPVRTNNVSSSPSAPTATTRQASAARSPSP